MNSAHIKEWPDKILFAGMTLAMAGTLGVLFDIGRIGGITVDAVWLNFLEFYPTWLSLVFNVLTLAFGIVCIKSQAWLPAVLAALAGIVSLGFLLIVPLLSLVAIVFVIMGTFEGEEMDWDEHVVSSHMWPDKAIAASMMLAVGGILSIIHGLFLIAGDLTPLIWVNTPAVFGTFAIVFGLVAFWGARHTFKLESHIGGKIGAACCVAGTAFYFIGPVLGILAFMMIGMAERETEFTKQITN